MRFLGFSLIFLITSTAYAETRYITDRVLFHLLETPERSAKRLGTVPSGSKVTVLESNVQKKYSKVKTADGKVGYVETRRLVRNTVASRKLHALQKENSSLKKKLKKRPGSKPVKAKPLKESAAIKKLKRELKRKNAKIRSLKQELNSLQHLSRNELRIAQERNRLYRKTEELTQKRDQLKQQLDYADKSNLLWLILGSALVLLLGLTLGLLLPHLNMKREKPEQNTNPATQ